MSFEWKKKRKSLNDCSKNRSLAKTIGGILLAVMLVAAMSAIPAPVTVYADTTDTTDATDVTYPLLIKNGALDGVKVRFRPAGSHKPLSINDDGNGSQNCVHLYYNGHSSQFCLRKADDESYYIYFYQDYKDKDYKTTGDCVLDVERQKNDASYLNEGQIIHVTDFSDSENAKNKRWKLIQQEDGTYYVQNVRSGKYWSLNELDKPKVNNNKLVQRAKPLKWEMEIVSGDNQKLETIKHYDSMNFTYDGKQISTEKSEGEQISSLNWMGALPGTLRITDISIPGTHDVGTCWVHSDQGHSSDQRYYMNELLNAGVRHFDLRTGWDDDHKNVRIVHASHHCLDPEGKEISLRQTMEWITDFLDANPTETIVLQVKMDREGETCEKETYNYLKTMAEEENSYIWKGDHVPTLKEVRGKIILISRLDVEGLGTSYNFKTTVDGKPALWGLDCSDWKESKDYATDRVTSGEKNVEYEVWTQDDYGHSAGTKKDYIKAALLGSAAIGKSPADNSTLDRYIDAKLAGKHAWVFNYTSTSNGQAHPPFELCKEIHQWLYDHNQYDDSDRLVCGDTFTGVFACDFQDELLASFIYKTNFRRQYVTIHGVSPDGKEPFKPLTLYVGESEKASKLLDSTTTAILKKYYNKDNYSIMTANSGGFLADVDSVTSQGALEEAVARTRAALNTDADLQADLYVYLNTPIKKVNLDVDMPKCGTAVSVAEPKVTVDCGDGSGCEMTKACITQSADSETAFEGTVSGGKYMPVQINLAPKWGYRFLTSCAVGSANATIENADISGGSVKIKATSVIGHDTSEVAGTEVSCEENGTLAHYVCDNCGKLLLEKKVNENDEKATLVEVDESEIITAQALGHDWVDDDGENDGWIQTKAPSEEADGEMTRTCKRCDKTETLAIPALTHEHTVTHVDAKTAKDCTEVGNKEYWKCVTCGSYFVDEELKRQCGLEDVLTKAGPHNWHFPAEVTDTIIGDTCYVTKTLRCLNDDAHSVTQTVPGKLTITEPTCEEEGSIFIEATFSTGEPYAMIRPVDALGHDWSDWEVKKEATCCETGEKAAACIRCGETKAEEIPIDENTHDKYLEIDETTNSATCENTGRATAYEICSNCGKVFDTKRIDTSPLDHEWGAPIYEWSADKSKVTASRICTRMACGESEYETVSTTTRLRSKASFETVGSLTCEATFKSEAFDTQEAVASIPKVISAKLSPVSFTYDGKEKKPVVTLIDADGQKVETSIVSVNYSNNTKAGTATAKITLDSDLYEGSKNVTFKINKAASPMKLKARTVTVKYSKLKNKAQTLKVTKMIKFTRDLKDRKLYRISSAKKGMKNVKKYFKINKKNGKVTVKKGLKKGTYKVKIKVKAAGNNNYEASAWKTVTSTIKIK